ncbi:protein POLR1D-like [Scomber japonicus]|uniref:protein POLR1D-like n=1 Tax=Scomber japonicus TaxID=13676 RepID=UPI002305BEA5|nr:protein POLR1D-like [Scomber japonicus]
MADDSELERRAVEELLKETDRARVRAETMGPAGWLKCPLRSTNKRFLLNTLRSTGMQQRTGEPAARRGRPRSESPNRSRSRSRTPPRDHRNNGGHAHHKHHRSSRSHKDKKQDRDIERSHKQKDNRDRRHGKDGPSTDKDRR